MPTSTFTFDNLREQAKAIEPPPAGTYDCICSHAEATQSKTGKHMIKARYTILNGPEKGKNIFNNLVFSPENDNAIWFFFENIEKAHGVPLEGLGSNDFPIIAAKLVGKEVRITAEEREYEGRQTLDVKRYEALNTGPKAPPKKGPKAPPPPKALRK